MVEIAYKRFEIRRERVGIENGLQRGVLSTAANVEEAVSRLKEVEGRLKTFHEQNEDDDFEDEGQEPPQANGNKKEKGAKAGKNNPNSKARLLESLVDGKVYKEGRVTHRPDPELKTHTSYLLFAILPQEWSAEDEEKARAKWPVRKKEAGTSTVGMSKREMKKAARQAQKEKASGKKTDIMEANPQTDTAEGHGGEGGQMQVDDAVEEVDDGNSNPI
jgi:tRNA (adenine57-N1/adenine58-N1)-methyltransferase catalytic subunit